MQQAIAVAPHCPTAEVMGGWRLVRKIAESRWFIVSLAAPASCDPDWPADYALKWIQPALVHDSRPRQLLHREMQVSADISHPHLATVLDADLDHERPFIVQPFYEGANVRELLHNGALSISQALWITRQVVEALAALHAREWIHGDIKPDNVIASRLGHVTLVDLGFARRNGLCFLRGADSSLQTTLAYAAPELFLPQVPQSPASDVYSLGVMLYEMLAGRTPFASADPHELARHHLHADAPDIRRINPLIPHSVAKLVMQLLVKAPAQRTTIAKLMQQIVACEIECFVLR